MLRKISLLAAFLFTAGFFFALGKKSQKIPEVKNISKIEVVSPSVIPQLKQSLEKQSPTVHAKEEIKLSPSQNKIVEEIRKWPRSLQKMVFDDLNESFWNIVRTDFLSPNTEEEVAEQRVNLWNHFSDFREEKFFQASIAIPGKKGPVSLYFMWRQGVDAIDADGNFSIVRPGKDVKPERIRIRNVVYRADSPYGTIGSAWEQIGYFPQSAGKYFAQNYLYDDFIRAEGVDRIVVETPLTAQGSAEVWFLRQDGERWERAGEINWSAMSKEDFEQEEKKYSAN